MSDNQVGFAALLRHFAESEIEWRVGRSGISKKGQPWVMPLAYLTSRAVMDRLDDVVGPDLWQDEYRTDSYPDRDGAPKLLIECRLSLFCGQDWITKCDVAPPTDFEPIKGGYSDAFKRAAVKWGIGRYLYSLEPSLAQTTTDKPPSNAGYKKELVKDGTDKVLVWWKPPSLPDWALPKSADLR